MNKKSKKVAVVGFSITGKAVTKYLLALGEKVSVFEKKGQEEFEESKSDEYRGVIFTFESDEFNPTDFDYIVVSPGVPLYLPSIKEAIENGVEVHNDVTLFIEQWRGKGPIIGVTGSNGKTTVVSLLHECLKKKMPVILAGNVGNSPLDILSEKHEPDTAIILELSSYQLELFKPEHYVDTCVITNLSSNHLDRYGGKMTEYAKAKVRCINDDKTDIILTLDDPGTAKYIMPEISSTNIQLVSFELPLDQATITGVYMDAAIQLVYFEGGDIQYIFTESNDRKLVGLHNLYNIAFVLAVLKLIKVEIDEDITKTVRDFAGLEHRIEFVRNKDGVLYINDSKSTSPDATRVALDVVGGEKNVFLIMGGDDKDMSFENIEEVLRDKVKSLFIVPGNLDKKIISTAEKVGDIDIKEVSDMDEAVKLAHEGTDLGDVVLLSPSSYSKNTYKTYEHRGRHFKELVNNL